MITMHFWKGICVALALGAIGGCGSTPSPEAEPTIITPIPDTEKAPADSQKLHRENSVEEVYRVGPGDVLSITVIDEPDISGNFRISAQGNISWTWVGNVDVSGLTNEEIKQRLQNLLSKDYIWNPRVEVDIKDYRSQVVYFFGNVAIAGPARLGENRSLLQNLLQAGGPKVWGDSVITILRAQPSGKKSEKTIVSLQALLSGDTPEDILLQNGDIVTVATEEGGTGVLIENRVYIVGAVKNPGSFPWRENLTALDILMAADGLDEHASGNRARLVREAGGKEEEIRIRFDDILDGERDQNITLQPGDLIIVPESWIF